jgi:hypothetical protein
MTCQVNGQIGIAEWMAIGPYKDWKLKGYRCITGNTSRVGRLRWLSKR